MFCPNCGKEINEFSSYCLYCGKEVLKNGESIQVKPVTEEQKTIQTVISNQIDKPEINVRVIQDPSQNIGFGMEYALHSNKSYIGSAWLTILLYIIAFWIGGFIANIVYLNAAKNTRRIIKRDPPGLVFLIVLLILGLIVLVLGIIIPLAVTCSVIATAPFYTPLTS